MVFSLFDDLLPEPRELATEGRRVLGDLIVKDIGEALEEDQRQDEVLKLGRIGRTPDGACRVPEPGLQGRNIEVLATGGRQRQRCLVIPVCGRWCGLLGASTGHSSYPQSDPRGSEAR